jgi:DNA-binding NarL/FixJ family response regulator
MTGPVEVLIVDDDVPTRVGVRTILSFEPEIEVVGEAATGPEACGLALELEPDVVLMDVHLPGFDGIEATRRITTAPAPGRRVPRVIVLTTFDFDEYVYRSLQAGASGFLLKRTRAEELVEAVLTVAAGSSLPTPSMTTALVSRFTERATDRLASPLSALTSRECDILTLMAQGLSNQEISGSLSISVETVRTHVKRVYAKLGARDRVHAVIAAYESGLVPRPPVS